MNMPDKALPPGGAPLDAVAHAMWPLTGRRGGGSKPEGAAP
ncbi:hypothetical protein ACN3XK_18745 [Actinomadura welshii]